MMINYIIFLATIYNKTVCEINSYNEILIPTSWSEIRQFPPHFSNEFPPKYQQHLEKKLANFRCFS